MCMVCKRWLCPPPRVVLMLDVSGWMTNCHGSSASAVLDCAGAALEKPVFGRLNYTALGEGPVTNARNARTIDGRTRVPYDMHEIKIAALDGA